MEKHFVQFRYMPVVDHPRVYNGPYVIYVLLDDFERTIFIGWKERAYGWRRDLKAGVGLPLVVVDYLKLMLFEERGAFSVLELDSAHEEFEAEWLYHHFLILYRWRGELLNFENDKERAFRKKHAAVGFDPFVWTEKDEKAERERQLQKSLKKKKQKKDKKKKNKSEKQLAHERRIEVQRKLRQERQRFSMLSEEEQKCARLMDSLERDKLVRAYFLRGGSIKKYH